MSRRRPCSTKEWNCFCHFEDFECVYRKHVLNVPTLWRIWMCITDSIHTVNNMIFTRVDGLNVFYKKHQHDVFKVPKFWRIWMCITESTNTMCSKVLTLWQVWRIWTCIPECTDTMCWNYHDFGEFECVWENAPTLCVW